MDDINPNPATEPPESRLVWHALPFDPATNFSLLGWILNKFMQGRKPEKTLDFNLDSRPSGS